jgi:hypothetical protein
MVDAEKAFYQHCELCISSLFLNLKIHKRYVLSTYRNPDIIIPTHDTHPDSGGLLGLHLHNVPRPEPPTPG